LDRSLAEGQHGVASETRRLGPEDETRAVVEIRVVTMRPIEQKLMEGERPALQSGAMLGAHGDVVIFRTVVMEFLADTQAWRRGGRLITDAACGCSVRGH
jgi:hypothetical protein